MSSLTTYRARVPGHASVPNETVTDALAQAAALLDSTAWSTLYAAGAIQLAAHIVEKTPGSGANGNTAAEVGAITNQSDSQSMDAASSTLSRTYAQPLANTPEEDELSTTVYGRRFLALRAQLAATGPGFYLATSTGCSG